MLFITDGLAIEGRVKNITVAHCDVRSYVQNGP